MELHHAATVYPFDRLSDGGDRGGWGDRREPPPCPQGHNLVLCLVELRSQCEGRDLNSHAEALASETSVSAVPPPSRCPESVRLRVLTARL